MEVVVHRYRDSSGSEPFTEWVDYGPGYRVYFAREGNAVVMLLCGGDKRRQDADIEKAIALWKEHESRRGRK